MSSTTAVVLALAAAEFAAAVPTEAFRFFTGGATMEAVTPADRSRLRARTACPNLNVVQSCCTRSYKICTISVTSVLPTQYGSNDQRSAIEGNRYVGQIRPERLSPSSVDVDEAADRAHCRFAIFKKLSHEPCGDAW